MKSEKGCGRQHGLVVILSQSCFCDNTDAVGVSKVGQAELGYEVCTYQVLQTMAKHNDTPAHTSNSSCPSMCSCRPSLSRALGDVLSNWFSHILPTDIRRGACWH